MPSPVQQALDETWRRDSRRVLATLIRLLGDFELAEEALHEAFLAAASQWERDGIPANPRAWLVSTGRFRAIDQLRRRARFDASVDEIAERLYAEAEDASALVDEDIVDDRLRLIFTCCHPSLAPDAQIALTLREVCGLTTEEIAHAFLTSPSTLAQRIVRAKAKIRDAGIPYEVPSPEDMPERLGSVLAVIYLVFNEGYSSSMGDEVTRQDLSAEAIRLGRLLVDLLPAPETQGLLALMLLHDSRRLARTSPNGDIVLLDEQDHSLWDHDMIAEGAALVRTALSSGQGGAYAVQAAIAAVHAESSVPQDTNWAEIVGLYDVLLQISPSVVVELNRAVAVAMRDGPEVGLALVESLLEHRELARYHLAHAARADLCRRLDRTDEARASYMKALEFAEQEPERRFLQRRLNELGD